MPCRRPLMRDHTLAGPWVKRFLLEHVVAERNLAKNTQHSYRDTIALLIPFVSTAVSKQVEQVAVDEVSADVVRAFLKYLEEKRSCCIRTRNQRLAAIHALAGFIGERSPQYVEWCGAVRSVPFKNA